MKNFLCIAALLSLSLTVGVAAQEADSAKPLTSIEDTLKLKLKLIHK